MGNERTIVKKKRKKGKNIILNCYITLDYTNECIHILEKTSKQNVHAPVSKLQTLYHPLLFISITKLNTDHQIYICSYLLSHK